MASKFGPWWQKIQQHPVRSIIIIGVGLLAAVALVALTGKTLWDWLQLLIIPIMLLIGGFWLNEIQKSREEEMTKQGTEAEQEIARDNQHEAALQAYIDKMSELLLKEGLRESNPDAEVRSIGRARTLRVLSRLDTDRKESGILFLCDSDLISTIDLSGAELSGIGLINANLRKAQLSWANLREADLQAADFTGADLRFAKLGGACLYDAKLSGTDVLGVELIGTKLSGAKLSKARLISANLSNAILGEASRPINLSDGQSGMRHLPGADLTDTNLYIANLTQANLRGANLTRTDLNDTVLTEADLSGANIFTKQLDTAKSLKGTTMPDGSIHP